MRFFHAPFSLFAATLFYSSLAFAYSDIVYQVAPANSPNYWTNARLKNAKPFPLPKISQSDKTAVITQKDKVVGADGAPPIIELNSPTQLLFKVKKAEAYSSSRHDRGTAFQDFSSSQLVPLSADNAYPYRTVGKLFFTKPGSGDFVCSAAVIRKRIVMTAGHCVHDGLGDSGFFTNFLFVPAYRDGNAPFQAWHYTFVVTSKTWATGGGTLPNAADYAALEMEDHAIANNLRRIGEVTGYLGYQTHSLIPNHAHLIAYAENLDGGQKMHQVTAQSIRPVAPNNAEYGSDMLNGSSGGPWIQNFGMRAQGQMIQGINRLIGIASYGYDNVNIKSQGSSIFDTSFLSVLTTACAHKFGNC